MNSQSNTLDYQQCIQNAALAFLERHQAEHLGDPSTLHNRTIDHLVNRFNMAKPIASKLTALAHIELVEVARRTRSAHS
ncbi:hypothetical protein [Pseudomonas synxantha]|uniref:Uncharacterized protein n=1 Tax=Pseudomonas synxantha TaxID=47883 RepID=A0AAU8TQQ3_9PSED|nr:hypothetical protein [Pseudomonas synxantha]AKA83901.1 hypothetical protein VO64_3355 [Pseudomonas synxantha]